MKPNILYIGNQLAARGKTATTIDTLAPQLRAHGYRIRTSSNKTNKYLRLVDMLWSVVAHKNSTDIVLIDTYSTQNFWYAIAVAKLCNLLEMRYIPILHGGNLPQRLQTNAVVLKRYLDKAHLVVCPSEYLKSAFAKANYSNFHLIPNSIELFHYPFKQRKSIQPKLLWVRSFAQIYHPKMALEVLELLKKSHPDSSLTMVGPDKDGSLQECKEFALENGLQVDFKGLLSKQEWVDLSASHDIFINTANFDNMPVSVIEAMALGLPVVSTNVGGMSYLIKHQQTGWLVPQGDAQQMVHAITTLVSQPVLVGKLTGNSRDYVRKLDWNRIKVLWDNVLMG